MPASEEETLARALGKRHWAGLVGAVLLALAIGYVVATYGVRSPSQVAAALPDNSVTTAKPRQAVAALGRVEPRGQAINLSTGVPDRLESLSATRGEKVAKDHPLGYLQGHAEQVARREYLAAQLREANDRLAAETALNLARIEEAEVRLKQVRELSAIRLAVQEVTISGLEVSVGNEEAILQMHGELQKQNVSARRTYENQRAVVLKGQRDLLAARMRLEEIRQQALLDERLAAAQLRVSRAALDRAKAEIPIDSLTKQIDLADALVRQRTIYAPFDGTVLNIVTHPGELVTNKAILTIGDVSAMRVVAEVYETDVTHVRLGQRATVTSRALTKPLSGEVVEIGQMVFKNDVLNVDPAARADARVVEVRIELDEPAETARLTNLTVDVLIDATAGARPPGPSVAHGR